jgi:hypothetical protein
VRLKKHRPQPSREVEHLAPSTPGPIVVDPVAGAVAFVRWLLERDGCATERADSFWCPVCAADGPSLRVTEAQDDGLALLECTTGCQPTDVLAALGLRIAYSSRDDVSLRLSAVVPLAVS